MNIGVSTIIAEGFLKGAFDVLDAMLSLSFTRSSVELSQPEPEALARVIAQHPVALRAQVKSGGAVALLLSVADASRFASMVLGEAPIIKAALDPNDIATLREVADPCLGGGITNLMEKFGRNVEQPGSVDVEVLTAESVDDLAAFLGNEPVLATFRFSAAPDIESAGALLFAPGMEALVPPGQAQQAAPKGSVDDLAANAQLSDAEMSDILSGFGPESAVVAAEQEPRRASREAPPNLDMVLDIRLAVTARLGRVDMPIGDILSLGPGSIIPVGHLIDEPVELLVNDKLIARGDVVVVDERFGLRITEIVSPKERIESLQ